MKKVKSEAVPPAPEPFSNPFAKLGPLRDRLPPDRNERRTRAEKPIPARAVVRRERKGHGGKEVTLVEQLELSPNELEAWLRELKTSLGCGGILVDGALMLQGDQRERIQTWLVRRGVKRVTVG